MPQMSEMPYFFDKLLHDEFCQHPKFHNHSCKKSKFRKGPQADSGLVNLGVASNLGVVSNVFFNNQQHEIEIERFIYVKQINSSFFSNSGNQRFYLQYNAKRENWLSQKIKFPGKFSGYRILALPHNILRLVKVSRGTW